MRITAPELIRLEVMDETISEPLGGAHSDPVAAFPAIKSAIMSTFRHYENMTEREIQLDRSVDAGLCRSDLVGWLQWLRQSSARLMQQYCACTDT